MGVKNSTNVDILRDLKASGHIILTPSKMGGSPYDDRFILKYAYNNDGVVISNDKYRDLRTESEGNF